MYINFKLLHPNAKVPLRATPGSACFDLFTPESFSVAPAQCVKVGLGVALAIPKGYVGLLFPRSGLGSRGLRLANCTGVIDSDYRGEVIAAFYNDNVLFHMVAKYDAVAQLMIMEVPQCSMFETDELDFTERGDGGFGSTDSKR